MQKKITVIGGSGFVGTNLCRQLAMKRQDFEIIDLKVSSQYLEKCKIADIRDTETLRNTITGDVVVNLAAVHRDDVRDKTEYQRTNVDGAANVAAVCGEKGVKKIVLSTEFSSAKGSLDKFTAPFQLSEGLQRTLYSEYISPDPNREIFYTE